MTEEVKTPVEQGQPSTETQTTGTTETKTETSESLDDVYKRFNVEAEAQKFNARPQQTPQVQREEQPADLNVPDPTLDPNGYKAYETRKAKDVGALRQALQSVEGKLSAFAQAAIKQAEEADIRTAVSEINDHLGEKKLDQEEVEIRLGTKARKDPRFMTIWQNRHQNPAALKAALKAVAGEIGKKTEYRVDPQIAENQRALKEATSTKATTAPEQSQDEKLGKLQGAEFERAMNRIKHGLSPF